MVQIIPRAIDYFTGKALEYEDFDDDDDFEDIDDDDEDEDDFEDDVCLYPVPLPHCDSLLTTRVGIAGFRRGRGRPGEETRSAEGPWRGGESEHEP